MNIFSSKQQGMKVIALLTISIFLGGYSTWADVGAGSVEQLIKENQELRQLVGDLSQKMDQLENRVSQTERAPQAVSVAAPAGAPEDGVMRTKGGDIELSGFVDTSFNWNFRTPPVPAGGTSATGNSTLRSFDRESNTFDLNNIQLNFKRPAPEAGGVGFNSEFTYGTDAGVIESAPFAVDAGDELSIQEANIEIRPTMFPALTVWAGKFATLHGAEVIENFMNWNASRSLLFNNAIPFTHTGIRALYNWLDGKVQTGAGLVNGWDSVIDNNNFKDIEAMLQWTPNENFSIRQNFMVGTQIVEDRSDNRWLLDTVATWKPLPKDLPKLTLMANYDYATQERGSKTGGALSVESGPSDWQGYALYAKYDLLDWLTLAARWEQFWDDQAIRTGAAALNQLWEMTYTADIKVYKNLLTRLEYRHDNADSKTAFDGATAQNQDTVGASLVYLFG